MAGYEHKRAEGESETFTLAEQHLYGASRIGMTKPNLALNTTTPDAASPTIHYELTNHLGNVMAVITDEPTDAETPVVESLADYYPFGMTMPGRLGCRRVAENSSTSSSKGAEKFSPEMAFGQVAGIGVGGYRQIFPVVLCHKPNCRRQKFFQFRVCKMVGHGPVIAFGS